MKSTQAIRRMLVIVCLVAPLSVPGLSSAATISGSICQKEGLLRNVNGNGFVCKKGKWGKLRWRLQTATTSGDPKRIVDNGYINLDGVRISGYTGSARYGMPIVERCGRIGEQVVKIWFKYADGRIRDERWIFNGKQVFVFDSDQYGNPAWRPVYVEASGLDPYGEEWTEENGFATTEWIWCANRKPFEPQKVPVSPTPGSTCSSGGVCAVGDTGPGGGIVFYVHPSGTFSSAGSDCGPSCRYLEAAPSDQSTGIEWATRTAACYRLASTSSDNNCLTHSVYSGNEWPARNPSTQMASEELGMGMANTNQIHARLTTAGSAPTRNYAAGIAWAYTNNGKSDWHLPSERELNELCKYARNQTTGNIKDGCGASDYLVESFSLDNYWSSSEWSDVFAFSAHFGLQERLCDGKACKFRVRPVRAF